MWPRWFSLASLLTLCAACGSSDSAPQREIEPLAVDQIEPTDIITSGSHIYWLSSVTRGKVLSLAKSGGDPLVLTEADAPHSLAVNSEYVYFGESDSALKRVSIAGGSAASVALQNVTDVALGSQRAFGTSESSDEVWSVPLQGGALFRVNDFTFVEQPTAILVDDTEVFWINRLRAEISAFPIEVSEEPGTARVVTSWMGDSTTELVSKGSSLYWADHSTGEILSAPKSGGEPSILANAAVQFLEVDATHIYFSTGEGDAFEIRRVDISGGDSELLVELDELPGGLALDATHVYWTAPVAGTVQAVAK